ncbi:MAG: metal-dependent hydrolase [Candidatus Aminicenantaceae bacterium]
MPDLVTHFAAAYILKVPRQWSKFRIPFYIGAILPDLLSRPFYIIYPSAAFVVYSFHTPLVTAVVCLLIAQFFQEEIRPGVRRNLFLGIGLHYGLDLMQKYLISGYVWLFPFSWKSFSLQLFWSEEALQFVPVWVALVLGIETFIQIKKRIRKENLP